MDENHQSNHVSKRRVYRLQERNEKVCVFYRFLTVNLKAMIVKRHASLS